MVCDRRFAPPAGTQVLFCPATRHLPTSRGEANDEKRNTRMNRVLAHTGVAYPIVQAPMGWIARSQLASAVSNAGGLGIIETSSGEGDQCLGEVARMKELTRQPFGVKLPIL